MPDEQRIVRFSGNVQGVGFRFAASRVAEGYSVAGYVKNLPDGRVECLIEGDAAEIDAFLAALSARMSGCVRGCTHQSQPPTGRYRRFDVKF